MSEIKVNKISPKTACGTTTLGDSGDTFTIPAGVSITNSGTASGFGATGAVSWNTTVKSAGFTAVAGEGYFVDTSSGALSVNLPAGTVGAVVGFSDYAQSFDTHALTLVQNGSDKIAGSTVNASLGTEGVAVTLVFVDSTKGWIVTDSGLQSDAPSAEFIAATGGNTTTTCGNFKIHAFTSPGTFCVSAVGNSAGSNTVQVALVAAGGGGGGDRGGAGGAGGVVLTPCAGVTISASPFPISVGGGGSSGPGPGPGPGRNGGQGANTTGISLTAIGGGYGVGGGGGVSPDSGGPGGSGGGGSVGDPASQPHSGGPGTQTTQPGNSGTYGFGNNGGSGNPAGNPLHSSGGGGGAGAVGGSGSPSSSGTGGAGKDVTPIFGAAPKAFYGPENGILGGGGGGGASNNVSPGPSSGGNAGTGGGGDGGDSPDRPGNPTGDNAAANTGGGGGGGSNVSSQGAGGSGGSGIVLIRYKFQ